MTVNQIYTLVNSLAKQAYGETPVTVVDGGSLVSLGNYVLSSETSTDVFTKTLVDRIGKTIVSNRAYTPEAAVLLKDPVEYGAILQKIYIEPMDAEENDSWTLLDGTDYSPFVLHKPTVKQKLFAKMTTFDIPFSIPDIQLKTAFESAESMAAMISGVFTSVQMSMSVRAEQTGKIAYANFIAEKIKAQKQPEAKGVHAVNLLSLYNTAHTSTLDVDTALTDVEFLKFATATINLYRKRMRSASVVFNTDGYIRHTPDENMSVCVLADFATAVTSYLQADTYHNEMVALPNYTEITSWQGLGTSANFDEVSKIAITPASGGANIEQSGIICVLTDVNAIAMTVENVRMKSIYNPRNETTNYFNKADYGYMNDMSENGIVFYVATTT